MPPLRHCVGAGPSEALPWRHCVGAGPSEALPWRHCVGAGPSEALPWRLRLFSCQPELRQRDVIIELLEDHLDATPYPGLGIGRLQQIAS